MRSYFVKENHVGSADSEILRYKHNDIDPVTLLKGLDCFALKNGVNILNCTFLYKKVTCLPPHFLQVLGKKIKELTYKEKIQRNFLSFLHFKSFVLKKKLSFEEKLFFFFMKK